jgi:hypothetical protein
MFVYDTKSSLYSLQPDSRMQTWEVVDTLIASVSVPAWNGIFTKSKMLHCYHDSNAACMTLV